MKNSTKKIILFSTFLLLATRPALANSNCFIAIENDKVIKESGNCEMRHSPCSTFKIAIALMGYDDGFLVDETHPKLPFQKNYPVMIEAWRESQTPTSWIKNSVVWYSQIITRKLGDKKFSSYIEKFNYGNRDISGDVGKNNGLTESWLGSSLQISPQEQVHFLQKILDGKIPLSAKAREMTKNILFVEDLPNNWRLYGKTGSCDIDDKSQNGWFVGLIEKADQQIIFANYLEDKKNLDYSGGKQAKEQARKKLLELIKNQS